MTMQRIKNFSDLALDWAQLLGTCIALALAIYWYMAGNSLAEKIVRLEERHGEEITEMRRDVKRAEDKALSVEIEAGKKLQVAEIHYFILQTKLAEMKGVSLANGKIKDGKLFSEFAEKVKKEKEKILPNK